MRSSPATWTTRKTPPSTRAAGRSATKLRTTTSGGPPGRRSVHRRATSTRVSSTLAMARSSPAKMPPAPRRASRSDTGCPGGAGLERGEDVAGRGDEPGGGRVEPVAPGERLRGAERDPERDAPAERAVGEEERRGVGRDEALQRGPRRLGEEEEERADQDQRERADDAVADGDEVPLAREPLRRAGEVLAARSPARRWRGRWSGEDRPPGGRVGKLARGVGAPVGPRGQRSRMSSFVSAWRCARCRPRRSASRRSRVEPDSAGLARAHAGPAAPRMRDRGSCPHGSHQVPERAGKGSRARAPGIVVKSSPSNTCPPVVPGMVACLPHSTLRITLNIKES